MGAEEIWVRPGNLPNAASRRLTMNGIISARFKPFTFRIVGALDNEKFQKNTAPIKNLFNPDHIPEVKQQAHLLSLQAEFQKSQEITAQVQFDLLRSKDKTYDPLFQDSLQQYQDTLPEIYINFFRFTRPGEIITSFSKSEENSTHISGYIQRKIGHHRFVLGGDWQRRTLRRFQTTLYYGLYLKDFDSPIGGGTIPYQLNLRNYYLENTFGYDVFGNKITEADEVNDGPLRPWSKSYYLEDRYRTTNLYLSAGICYDIFSSHALIIREPQHLSLINYYNNIPLADMKRASIHKHVMPRVNGTLLLNNRLSFLFNYGKYVQPVRYEDAYPDRGYIIKYILGGYIDNNPRGFDVQPVRNTQTVVGLSYQMGSSLKFQTSAIEKNNP